MILYVQTPAIPRSKLHNILIKSMIEYLDKCKQFSEIRCFVNIDAIKKSKNRRGLEYEWEPAIETKHNFEKIANKLTKTNTHINISNDPCFYLAFRHLTKQILEDIKKSNLSDDDYCVMWLEDDWSFIDKKTFNRKLNLFLKEEKYKVFTLYRHKINMGGNPDIIKGNIFRLFDTIDLSKDNKRDPENVRKFNVWCPYVFNSPFDFTSAELWDGHARPYNMLLSYFQEINENKTHPNRMQQDSILTSNTVEGEIGDQWRANIVVDKNWDSWDKLGIKSNKSFTYKL